MNGFKSSLALIIAIIAFTISLLNYPLKIRIDEFLSIAGVVVTAIAFLVGAYFSILAVSAYSHVRDIEMVKKNISTLEPKLLSMHDKSRGIARQLINLIDNVYSQQINSGKQLQLKNANRDNIIRRINDLYRRRSRLAIEYDYLDKDRREPLKT